MNPDTIALLLRTLRLGGSWPPEEARRAWASVDARPVLDLVRYEGAELWLYRRLRRLEVLEQDGITGRLRGPAHETTVSGLRVDEQTASVLDVLSRAEIPWALIKGQARRAAVSLYPFADARSVVDVDLLLPETAVDAGWELLRSQGYEPVFGWPTPWHTPHHRPALWDSRRVAVELHVTTGEAVPAAAAWRRATEGGDTVSWSGMTTTVPSATELVWQAVSHAVADGPKGYRLRAFLSAAAILAAGRPVDWATIAERMTADEVRYKEDDGIAPRDRIAEWLEVAAGLAGTDLPAELAPASADGKRLDLPRLLLWRGKTLRARVGRAARERLLEEGTRVEAGLPTSPAVEGAGRLRGARRRSASIAARAIYLGWRAGRG